MALPVVALVVGRAVGVRYLSFGLVLSLGLGLWALDTRLLYIGVRTFRRAELIAQRWCPDGLCDEFHKQRPGRRGSAADASAFDHPHRRQPGNPGGDSSAHHDVHNRIHVLVGQGGFFGQAGHRAGAHGNAAAL